MAIGTPFGLARTMTLGIVSNNERTFYPERMRIDEYETGKFQQLDSDGYADQSRQQRRAAGGYDRQSRRHQHARWRAKPQLRHPHRHCQGSRRQDHEQRRPRTTKGRVDRSDLGIDLKPLQDLETFYDVDINKGVLVNSVDRKSPAEKAGVKSQDILLDINGQADQCALPRRDRGGSQDDRRSADRR